MLRCSNALRLCIILVCTIIAEVTRIKYSPKIAAFVGVAILAAIISLLFTKDENKSGEDIVGRQLMNDASVHMSPASVPLPDAPMQGIFLPAKKANQARRIKRDAFYQVPVVASFPLAAAMAENVDLRREVTKLESEKSILELVVANALVTEKQMTADMVKLESEKAERRDYLAAVLLAGERLHAESIAYDAEKMALQNEIQSLQDELKEHKVIFLQPKIAHPLCIKRVSYDKRYCNTHTPQP
jgi:hypothetical protein